MTRRTVLMIEVDGDSVAERVAELVPDATVWGEVDGVQAALIVIDLDPEFV